MCLLSRPPFTATRFIHSPPVAQSFRLQFCHAPCTEHLHDPLTSHGTFRLCKGIASSMSLLSGQRLRSAPYFKLVPEASLTPSLPPSLPTPAPALHRRAWLQQASLGKRHYPDTLTRRRLTRYALQALHLRRRKQVLAFRVRTMTRTGYCINYSFNNFGSISIMRLIPRLRPLSPPKITGGVPQIGWGFSPAQHWQGCG